MNKYKVIISRNYCTEVEVIAHDEEEAETLANEEVDKYTLYGSELYDDYNGSVELLEENIEGDSDD